MATTAQHIAARSDPNLLERFIAAAEQKSIPAAPGWVQANLGTLISTPVSEGQTIADVHAYATQQREAAIAALPPAPGADPAAVTDAYLLAAIDVLTTPEQAPTPPNVSA